MLRPVLVVTVLALLPAVASAQTAEEKKRANDLKQIGLAYHNYYDANKKAPARAEDLAPYLENDKRLVGLLSDKEIVFFYDFDLVKIVNSTGTSKTVLAYDKDAPTKGGMVLFFDGVVRKVSAEDFKTLTQPKK